MKKIKVLSLVLILALGLFAFTACSFSSGGNDPVYFTVKFDTQGSGHISDYTDVLKDEKIAAPSPAPTKTGYGFSGWFTEKNGGTEWKFNTHKVVSDMTLYAKWTATEYGIAYENLLGGTNPNLQETYTIESAAITFTAPTRTGYTGAWDISTIPAQSTGDKIITAVWTAKEYAVQFDKRDGTGGTSNITATYAAAMPSATAPNKTGYVFGGYFDGTDGDGKQYYNSDMSSVNNWDVDSDTSVTLYALWNPSPNYLIFDGNGKTGGTMNNVQTQTGAEVTLPECGYMKTGYNFDTWNTKADGTGTAYAANGSYAVPASDESITLYAVWAAIEYNITYAETYGLTNSNPAKYTIESEFTFAALTGTRAGYEFIGWDTTGITAGTTDNKTVTAQWTVVYNITYTDTYELTNPNPATYTVYSEITFAALTGTRAGYTFAGWSIAEITKGTTGGKTIAAQWTAIEYNITYAGTHGLTNGNPAKYTIESEFVFAALTGTRAGCTFTGWNVTGITAGTTGNMTVTAQWIVPYIDENGITQSRTANDLTDLTSSDSRTLTGWYILSGAVSDTFTLTVSGTAHIILADGCSWRVNSGGIVVTEGNTLHIYAQSLGMDTGKLSTNANIGGINGSNNSTNGYVGGSGTYVDGSQGGKGGIGDAGNNGGTIIINGGIISAVNIGGGNGGAGSNGGRGGNGDGGIYLSNGYSGGTGGVGGNGAQGGGSEAITINGGTVSATNIGGGYGGSGGNGGSGGDGGSGGAGNGIGNGSNGGYGGYGGVGGLGGLGGDSGTITIKGGTVSAINIGGGNGGSGGSGGVGGSGGNGGVGGSRTGGNGGRGGNGGYGGNGGNGGSGGEIAITGGTVSATKIGGGNGGIEGSGNSGSSGGTGGSGFEGTGSTGGSGGSGGPGNIGTSGTMATVSVAGGSINANILGSPTNGAANGYATVSLVTITTAELNMAVDGGTISGAAYYSLKDVKTNASGILFLWLPNSVTGIEMEINDDVHNCIPITLNRNNPSAGNISVSNDRIVAGMQFTVTATTNTGFTWLGWYDGQTKKSSDLIYTFNMPSESLALTATWGDYSLTRTAGTAGGSVSGNSGRIVADTPVTILATTADGYTFLGWFDGDSETSVSTDLSYTFTMPYESVALTAKWIACPVTLTQNLTNAGTVSGVETTVLGAETTITATTNAGYSWLGWFDGNTKVSDGTSLTFTFTMSKSNKIYEARWGEYVLTLDRSSTVAGNISGDNGMISSGQSCTVTATTATGYTWLGWYDGDQKVSSNLTYTFDMPYSSITLTATWGDYTLSLISTVNGVESMAGGAIFGSSGRIAATTSCTVTASTATGYTWLGWYNGDEKVSGALSYEFDMPYANLTLTATWARYALTLAGYGASGSNGFIASGTMCTVKAIKSAGYTWLGWYNGDNKVCDTLIYEFAMPYKDITLTATWGEYTLSVTKNINAAGTAEASVPVGSYIPSVIIFNLNGATGTAPANQTITPTQGLEYPTAIPTRTNYIFAGWFDNGSGTGNPFDFTAPVASGYKTLYAKWIDVSGYNSIISIGGSISNINTTTTTVYYPFVPLVSQTVTVSTTNSSNLNATISLLNAAKSSTLASATDSQSYYASFTYDVIAGTLYYIGIRSASSSNCSLRLQGTTAMPDAGGKAVWTIAAETPITLTAATNIGFAWLGWYNGETKVSDGDNLYYTFNMPYSNIAYEARWEILPELSGFDFTSTPVALTITGYNGESDTVVIPSIATAIAAYAFQNKSALVSVTIPSSVSSVGNYAFSGCSGLTDITIDNGVTSIGHNAFKNCSDLTNVTIPNSVTSIGNYVFSGCGGLTSIKLPFIGSSRINTSVLGYLFGTESYEGGVSKSQYYAQGAYETYYIPSALTTVILTNVTQLRYGTFYNCNSITNIVLPDNMASIDERAFNNCTSLTSIVIPDSISNIYSYAFSGCTALTSVFYGGADSTAWGAVTVSSNNQAFMNATRYYYSETEPVTAGNYWHYDDGVPTVWAAI